MFNWLNRWLEKMLDKLADRIIDKLDARYVIKAFEQLEQQRYEKFTFQDLARVKMRDNKKQCKRK